MGGVDSGTVSPTNLFLFIDDAKPAVFSFLPFSTLQCVATCDVGLRRAVCCDPELWATRLVSHVDAAGHDRKVLEVELESMLDRIEHCGADAVASERMRSLASSPELRCTVFAPYLCHMSRQRPPTREQIELFVQEGLCQAHSRYKHLPLHHGVCFWVFLSPAPQAFGKTCNTKYGLLDWIPGKEGPPMSVRTPRGGVMPTPPGVASGRDSRVYLSASCCLDSCLSDRAQVNMPDLPDLPHFRRMKARMEQCAREQKAVYNAIVRQCRVIYGEHWDAK